MALGQREHLGQRDNRPAAGEAEGIDPGLGAGAFALHLEGDLPRLERCFQREDGGQPLVIVHHVGQANRLSETRRLAADLVGKPDEVVAPSLFEAACPVAHGHIAIGREIGKLAEGCRPLHPLASAGDAQVKQAVAVPGGCLRGGVQQPGRLRLRHRERGGAHHQFRLLGTRRGPHVGAGRNLVRGHQAGEGDSGGGTLACTR